MTSEPSWKRKWRKYFEIDIAEVNCNAFLFDFAQWDSLTHEQIMLGIEHRLHVRIPSDKRFDLMSITEIVDEAEVLLNQAAATAAQANPVA